MLLAAAIVTTILSRKRIIQRLGGSGAPRRHVGNLLRIERRVDVIHDGVVGALTLVTLVVDAAAQLVLQSTHALVDDLERVGSGLVLDGYAATSSVTSFQRASVP